jgi:D-tagatose 6-phosphate 4-epimerase
MRPALTDLAPLLHRGEAQGITSVCSAHPLVLRAALRHGLATGDTVLIEATCNQVNHLGGYTGMTPRTFAALVRRIAAEEHCPEDRIILGGDHLGPNPWSHLPTEEALVAAEHMVAAYVAAGFRKIHLDASMPCADDKASPDDETAAIRAARLAAVAEATATAAGLPPPLYVIGTEVPPPGGADHALTTIAPTAPDAARRTIAVHEAVFARHGLAGAFGRVIALVVQPGVEFGNHNVIGYDPARAVGLKSVLSAHTGLVFEAHSTDYQGVAALSSLVLDGFSLLKVGPELTFVLREALYGLDLIAADLVPGYGDRPLYRTMERLMRADPGYWQRHYGHDAEATAGLRHYSLSDRVRYYWTKPEAQGAVAALMTALTGRIVPLTLFWQHLPAAAFFADAPLDPEALLIWRITETLRTYHAACHPGAQAAPSPGGRHDTR